MKAFILMIVWVWLMLSQIMSFAYSAMAQIPKNPKNSTDFDDKKSRDIFRGDDRKSEDKSKNFDTKDSRDIEDSIDDKKSIDRAHSIDDKENIDLNKKTDSKDSKDTSGNSISNY